MHKGFVIAIDGPVAAGKSTLATNLAKALHGFYLWTGATYRCVALYCMRQGINVSDANAVIEVLPAILVTFSNGNVLLNGEDVTEVIKQDNYAVPTSIVSTIPQVRDVMRKLQQDIAAQKVREGHIVIAEGRDMGTHAFPDASLKLFLTATQEVRAKRRLIQMSNQTQSLSYNQVLQGIKDRDLRDTTRKASPLADDPIRLGYVVINDTNLTKGQTITLVVAELKKRNLYDSY